MKTVPCLETPIITFQFSLAEMIMMMRFDRAKMFVRLGKNLCEPEEEKSGTKISAF